MSKVDLILIKELRKRTDAGVMDCRKALIKSNGNIELAIDIMRISGKAQAVKKAKRIATEGLIKISIDGNKYGVILEINCETDFVAKDPIFHSFYDKVLETAIMKRITNLNVLKEEFEDKRIELVSKFGENINIRRFSILEGEKISGYVHNFRVGVLVAMQNASLELEKQISMQIVATKPLCIKLEDLDKGFISRERELQLRIALKSKKSKEIIEKIVNGRVEKVCKDMALVTQPFVINPVESVGEILDIQGANITKFIRFELGEIIDSI